jgi:hypothetical protein
MKKLPLLFAILLPFLSVACGESLPPPAPQGSAQDDRPDEVKQAESKFFEKQASKASKH